MASGPDNEKLDAKVTTSEAPSLRDLSAEDATTSRRSSRFWRKHKDDSTLDEKETEPTEKDKDAKEEKPASNEPSPVSFTSLFRCVPPIYKCDP